MNKNMHKDNPCKRDCAKRSPTCHAECKEYLEFHEERKKELTEKDKQREFENNYREHVKARSARLYKIRRYGGSK